MKILFVGDIHNHRYIFDDIERLDKEYNFDRIICLGDYVDDWNTPGSESLITLDKVISLKNSNPIKYSFCLGNHELSYLGYPCSGHQFDYEKEIQAKLEDNIELFDFFISLRLNNRDYYCSHAGFTIGYIAENLGETWKTQIEAMNKDKLNYLDLVSFCNFLRGGSNENSSFVWADKREHTYGINDLMPYQIAGHSPVKTITEQGYIYFIDTHSTYPKGDNIGDKSYLIWNETEFEIKY